MESDDSLNNYNGNTSMSSNTVTNTKGSTDYLPPTLPSQFTNSSGNMTGTQE